MKKQMQFIFLYKNMSVGGCQLLIEHLACSLQKNNNDTLVICSTMDRKIADELEKYKVEYLALGDDWSSNAVLKTKIKDNADGNSKIITFLWTDFIRCYSIANCSWRVFFYVVHYDALIWACMQKGKVITAISKSYIRRIVHTLAANKQILLMDEQTIERSEQFYKMTFDNPVIIRIPTVIDDSDFNYKKSVEKFTKKERNILAIARAEFPFKGYLLGLIDLIKDHKIDEVFRLTIVTYGRDYSEIEKRLQQCDEHARNRITLVGETKYSELKDLFYNSHVYIGMGTTLLDASKYGVISIPVEAYSYEVKAKDFFCNDIAKVTCETGSESKFVELLNTVCNGSSDVIGELIQKSYDGVKNNYSIESCVRKLTTLEPVSNRAHKAVMLDYGMRSLLYRRKG